jgi:hypothetical protein
MKLDQTRLILIATGFTVGFAALGVAGVLDHPAPGLVKSGPVAKQTVTTLADSKPVRIVGAPFVPNINPRER